jgi:hypothetical protein
MQAIADDKRTLQTYARWAGFMYLFSMAVYMAQDLILAEFAVRGDFAATALNAQDGEFTYRLGLMLRVIGTLTLLGLGWSFYGLLKPVAPTLALIHLVWRGVQTAFDGVGATFRYGMLDNYLRAPDAEAARAVAGQIVGAAHRDNFQIQFVYLGVASVILFWALYRSRFIPRPLALFSLVASAALIVQASAHLLAPEWVAGLGVGMLEYIPMFIAEIGTGLWLLIKGADLRQLEPASRHS